MRNKNAGHGAGVKERVVDDSFVEFTLDMVASNIIFLHKLYIEKRIIE